jgi:CRISPR system Cascade subunit CasA
MQAPVPGGNLAAFRRIDTPDGLDMLVTSKNHDLKRERMWNCEPEDWLYALISLQTQEGIMGGGKYGISRMNGGFGSRCMIGIDYAGDPCFRFRRDVAKLRSLPNGRGAPQGFRRDRISLVWLEPWDGAAQIAFADLHPLYVEICRRVRLRNENDRIHALETVSSKARIACPDDLKGNTGDPWTPVSVEGKAFSVSRVGFSYRRVCELLDSEKFRLPVLAQACSEDRKDGMAFVAQAVCRGQGKTEGYHERRLALGQFLGSDDFTAVARRRVEAMQELKMAFRLALFVLAQGGPDKVAADRDTTKRFVEPCLERFESGVDQTFFEDVKKELSAPEADRDSIFQSWLESQLMHAQTLLIASHQSMPHPAGRRYQARAQAGLAFRARLSKAPPFEFVFKAQENRETENELRRQ